MERPLPAALEPATRARRPTHPVLAVIVALAVALVPVIVLGKPVGDALGPLDFDDVFTTENAPRHAGFMAVIVATIIGLLWLWLRLYERRPLWTVGLFRGRVVGKVAAGFALGAVLNLLPLAVARVGGWGATRAKALPAWPLLAGGLALMALAWMLQAGTEEVVFRGFLTQAIAMRWPLAWAVVIQALAFSASHVLVDHQPVEFVALFLVGLFLVGYVLLEGDLWGACAFHGAWNWSNSVAVIWFTDAPGAVDTVRDFVIPVLATIVVAWLIRRRGVPHRTSQHAV
jgi:membrane protease YdiL (CAAX protease family)